METLQFEKALNLLRSSRGERYQWDVIRDVQDLQNLYPVSTWFAIAAVGYWLVTWRALPRVSADAKLLTTDNRNIYMYQLTYAEAKRLRPQATVVRSYSPDILALLK